MSMLDKLSAIIAARTPGPWKWRSFGGPHMLLADHGRRDVILSDALTRDERGILVDARPGFPNMDFIATMGSCADEILAVLKAANQLRENWTGRNNLFIALAALEAKIGEIK